LTPSQIAKRVSDALQGPEERDVVNSLVWSIRDKTVDSYGATRSASTVAPPYAKLYERVREVL
jgi:hypothetical protein